MPSCEIVKCFSIFDTELAFGINSILQYVCLINSSYQELALCSNDKTSSFSFDSLHYATTCGCVLCYYQLVWRKYVIGHEEVYLAIVSVFDPLHLILHQVLYSERIIAFLILFFIHLKFTFEFFGFLYHGLDFLMF